MEFAPKPANVFDAVGHVFAILPQAGERRVTNGMWASGRRFRGHIHLNDGTLPNSHLLKRAKHAIFVLGGDSHGVHS